ncbi:alpha/beta hydrolases superfamily protein [Tanacetum coccineum]
MEALEDQGEVFDTLMDLKDNREAAQTKLQGLNELITEAEQEIETKEAQIQAMNVQHPKVDWRSLVWFSQNIPSHAFVLWMAIQKRLITQDRIYQWNKDNSMKCSLCSSCMDSHDHLFFQCSLSSAIWLIVKGKSYIDNLNKRQFSNEKRSAVIIADIILENIGESNSRLRVEKSRPKAFETMAELSSLYIGVLLFERYGSILNILHGRNELLEKIIGCVVDSGGVPELDPKVSDIWGIMETEANDLDHLVNYDNDNDIDDLGYESEVYLDEEEQEDENNHSNGNVVKRGITRLYKFHREYGKPDGIKLNILSWKKVGSEARDKLWDEITVKSAAGKMARSKFVYQHTIGQGGYANVKQKMIKNKEIEPDEEPPRGIMWLKGRVNKDGQFPDDEIRSVRDKLKETEDKIKEGTLKVDHGTDAMTVVLGKKKGGYARGVGSGVTYKRYFDLPQSRQASNERIALLQSQLDNERREHQEKELEIQNLSNKMSETEGMDSKLMNQLAAQGQHANEDDRTPLSLHGCGNDASIQKSNGLATSKKEMETRETINSVGSKKRTKSLRKESSRQHSQSQDNVSPLLVLPQDYSLSIGIFVRGKMSHDVITVGSTMRIPLLYRGEYSQWSKRFMNYLEEQKDGEAMINFIRNGEHPLPVVAQVPLAGTAPNAPPTL